MAAPPKLNTPGVADAAVVAGVAAAAAPKLKLEPAGAGAAAAVVEAAAGCCPKEKSPLEGVLSDAAAVGASGFLPNPPNVDVAENREENVIIICPISDDDPYF